MRVIDDNGFRYDVNAFAFWRRTDAMIREERKTAFSVLVVGMTCALVCNKWISGNTHDGSHGAEAGEADEQCRVAGGEWRPDDNVAWCGATLQLVGIPRAGGLRDRISITGS